MAKWLPGGGADASGFPDALVAEAAGAAVDAEVLEELDVDLDFDDFPELDPQAASTTARTAAARTVRDVVLMDAPPSVSPGHTYTTLLGIA
ncbi:MAG TPA: hypothetical protein VFC33_01565 [Acidimicrobiia bacterium]|nr:hypothetical protein [Acidimicrobiia bacterium]